LLFTETHNPNVEILSSATIERERGAVEAD